MENTTIKQNTRKAVYNKQKKEQYLETKLGKRVLTLYKNGNLPPAPQNIWLG